MTSAVAVQTKVLLIEDNPRDARLLQELLRETGESRFAVEWKDRLSSGMERLGRGDVDVVLLDLALPDSSALPTFQRVRREWPC
jgi:DNA-binding response OmpR family regulator